jgi:hypothetical protein
MTPTFSVISDLYSPTQLQRALFEAQEIARAFMACAMEQERPTTALMDAFGRLQAAGTDAGLEHAMSAKRPAPKPQDVSQNG